jgi:ribulose-phosphate 3-epimerase
MPQVEASILSCDLTKLGEQVIAAQNGGADYLHVDIMDGIYVNNFTFGPRTVSDLKKITNLPINVHLEVAKPELYVEMFKKAGADIFTFQLDTCPNPIHLLKEIRQIGMKAGIGIGPSHSVERLRYLLKHVDLIVLMSVEPGYEKQEFEESVYEKITLVKQMMNQNGVNIPISVDGGVNELTGKKLVERGADILIAGSYIFYSDDISKATNTLKQL